MAQWVFGGGSAMNDGSVSEDLYDLFCAYFNPDWDMDFADWQGVVDEFASDHPEGLQALADEIDGVREAHPEPDLKRVLFNTLGCYYSPVSVTCHEWLRQIADRLRRHAATGTGNPPQQ
jgi:hypothetical protein